MVQPLCNPPRRQIARTEAVGAAFATCSAVASLPAAWQSMNGNMGQHMTTIYGNHLWQPFMATIYGNHSPTLSSLFLGITFLIHQSFSLVRASLVGPCPTGGPPYRKQGVEPSIWWPSWTRITPSCRATKVHRFSMKNAGPGCTLHHPSNLKDYCKVFAVWRSCGTSAKEPHFGHFWPGWTNQHSVSDPRFVKHRDLPSKTKKWCFQIYSILFCIPISKTHHMMFGFYHVLPTSCYGKKTGVSDQQIWNAPMLLLSSYVAIKSTSCGFRVNLRSLRPEFHTWNVQVVPIQLQLVDIFPSWRTSLEPLLVDVHGFCMILFDFLQLQPWWAKWNQHVQQKGVAIMTLPFVAVEA